MVVFAGGFVLQLALRAINLSSGLDDNFHGSQRQRSGRRNWVLLRLAVLGSRGSALALLVVILRNGLEQALARELVILPPTAATVGVAEAVGAVASIPMPFADLVGVGDAPNEGLTRRAPS